MERLIFILINFGYILIFAILGVACLLVKIPKESGMEYYIKARKTLGWSQIMMAIYWHTCKSMGLKFAEMS